MPTLQDAIVAPLAVGTVWELVISNYEHCTLAGKRPILATGFPAPGSEPEGCDYYRPHSFLFEQYPQATDYLRLVRHLPWLDCATSQEFRDAAVRDWSPLETGKKASHLYITDTDGRRIGEIQILRQDVYVS